MSKVFNTVKERVEYYGEDSSSLQDLLVMILGNRTSEDAIKNIGEIPIEQLLDMSVKDFEQLGLSKLNAKRLFYIVAFAKKLHKTTAPRRRKIRTPEDVYNAISWLRYENQENFMVLFLNTKGEVIGEKIVFKGTLNSSTVHPREIFHEAIKRSSSSIIVAHNHPSGNTTPSPEDIEITKRLYESGKLIGIPCLDHIIIGDLSYVSLKKQGYI